MSFLHCFSSLSISAEGWVLKHDFFLHANLCLFPTSLFIVLWAVVCSLIILFRFRGWQDPRLEWRERYKSSCVGWQTYRPHYLFAVQPQVHDLCQRMFQHGMWTMGDVLQLGCGCFSVSPLTLWSLVGLAFHFDSSFYDLGSPVSFPEILSQF